MHTGISLRTRKSRFRQAILIAATALAPATSLLGADKTWAGGTALWQTGTWLSAGAPTTPAGSGDNAYLISSTTLTVSRDLSSGNVSGLGTVNVDGAAGALVTFAKSGATTFSATNIINGASGRGAIDFSGGTITSQTFIAGQGSLASGSTGFSASLWQTASLVVGAAGAGTLNHSAGSIVISGGLALGQLSGGSGFYNLLGGTLAAGNSGVVATVGVSGVGEFDVNGGFGTLAGMSIGSNSNSSGLVNVNSGTLVISGLLRLAPGGGNATFQTFGGSTSIGSLQANTGAYLANLGGDVAISGGATISGGHVDLGISNFTVSATNTLLINDGYFAAGAISPAGGASVQFNSGTLVINNGNLNPASGLLGAGSIYLPQTKALYVSGTTTLQAAQPLVISGGTFSTGVLAGNTAALQFTSGTFRLSNSSLHFGSSGLFGAAYSLDSSKRIELGNGMDAYIDPSGQLDVSGGILSVGGTVHNNGVLQLSSPTARIAANSLLNQGLLQGNGRIIAPLNNDSAGEVRISTGEQLRFENPGHSNIGLISLLGGFADFTGALTNSGRVTGRGTLRTSLLSNLGTVALSAGVSDIYGDVSNASGGHIIISGNGNATFWDDVTNNAGASIKISPGSTASFFGTYAGAGISGGGAVNFESDITPGFSPAAISVGGNVRFGSNAKLRIELAGTTRGTQYDAVDIAGSATLDGELHVSTLNGFVPLPGTSFNVMSYGSRSDAFDIINDTGFAGLHINPIYSGSSLQLQMSGAGGDANLDGIVDIHDLYILATHFKQSGQTWLAADFNGDGLTNAVDLGSLAQNWQFGVGSPSGASLGELLASLELPVSVPEPAFILPGIGLSMLLRRRRRAF